jgi:hypothetical protein
LIGGLATLIGLPFLFRSVGPATRALAATSDAYRAWVALPLTEAAGEVGIVASPAVVNSLVMWVALGLWFVHAVLRRSTIGSFSAHASVLAVVGALQYLVWQYMPNRDALNLGSWQRFLVPVLLAALVGGVVLIVRGRLIVLAPVVVALMTALLLGTIGVALGQ